MFIYRIHAIVTYHIYRVSQTKFSLGKLSFILKVSYEWKIIIHVSNECYVPNRLVSLVCGVFGWTGGIVCESARIDLRKSIKVREWIQMRCIAICFFQKQSHTHTNTHKEHTHKAHLNADWQSLLGKTIHCNAPNFNYGIMIEFKFWFDIKRKICDFSEMFIT